ncbi:MAG TPA: universal stress protein [Acidimicrobiales bacterium]|nr:universal stress protein [Acidimicrobiales bacterium]
MQKIVVGVDNSPGARRALEWALDEAALRDATVVAVHAWQLPYVLSTPLGVVSVPVDDDATAEAEAELAAVIDEVAAAHPSTPVERQVVLGSPAAALIEEGADAQLIVVGSRGRGGFAGLLLGSVSHQLAHHAPCPVVIVPSPAD